MEKLVVGTCNRWPRACCAALLLITGWCPLAVAEAPGAEASVAAAAEASAPAPLRLADALTELGRLDEAADVLRGTLASDPDNSEAHRKLGSVLATLEGPAAGLAHLQRAVELDRADGVAHFEMAEALRMVDRWDEALVSYERAVALGLADENALTGQAEALLAVGRVDEARAKLDEALARYPDSRGLRFGLAWLCAASPEVELRDGTRALALAQELFTDRRSLGAAELIAAARAELGRCEAAAEVQRFVVEQARTYERPAEAMQRLEQALAWFEAEPCRIPEGRPVSERPYWPRRRASSGDA